MKIICDWENCNETGSYKAPIEKDNSKKYRLLCLTHIKIFNKNWNYFENMNDQEIEFFIKSDLTWHKSTKTFGSSENFFNILCNNALEDKLNIFKSSNFRDFKKFENAIKIMNEKKLGIVIITKKNYTLKIRYVFFMMIFQSPAFS